MLDTANNVHDHKCIANAMIAAIQNERDYCTDLMASKYEPMDPHTAAGAMYNTDFLAIAKAYLTDGTMSCICTTND